MKSIAVIPARLASKRLPRKVLADVSGHPLLWHTWQQAKKARLLDEVYVATDSNEIRRCVEAWDGNVLMTSAQCRSGTDRVALAVENVEADLVINLQADEPNISPKLLDGLVAKWASGGVDILTPIFRINDVNELLNPHVVKVVVDGDGRALYFSRAPIPHPRDVKPVRRLKSHTYWGHVGIYGFRSEVLRNFARLPMGALETVEKLEQLRLLEAGYQIHTMPTSQSPTSINTAEDLEIFREIMAERQNTKQQTISNVLT